MATFILVHGTFAKSAHWPVLQDSLAETTRAAGDTPSFEQLTWTGRNRAGARQAAASEIFELVKRILCISANEKIFIIGHSHGGSAIAYFLKEHPEAASALAGCAFLSTPFVAIRARRRAFWLMVLLLAFPYLLFMNIIPPPYYDISPLERLDLPYWSSAHWFYLFITLIGVAIFSLALFFVKRASDPLKVEQAIRQQTADIPAGNYLFLRCSGDEAAAGLSAFQAIAWLGMRGSRLLELVTRPFDLSKFSKRPSRADAVRVAVLFGIVPLAVTGLITFGWLKIFRFGVFRYFSPGGPFVEKLEKLQMLAQKPQNLNMTETVIYIFGYMTEIAYDFVAVVVLGLMFLCLFAVLLIFITQAVTSWVFGWTRLSTGFVVELAIEPLPFGEHFLTHIDWAAGSIGLDGMVHSWTYAHPAAIRHLQNWVSESLGKVPVSGAEPTTIRP